MFRLLETGRSAPRPTGPIAFIFIWFGHHKISVNKPHIEQNISQKHKKTESQNNREGKDKK
jgi:hypothetical protein